MTKIELCDIILISYISRRYFSKMFNKKKGLWFIGFILMLFVVCFLSACNGNDKINIDDSTGTETEEEAYNDIGDIPQDTANLGSINISIPSTVYITGSAGSNYTTRNTWTNTTATTEKPTTTTEKPTTTTTTASAAQMSLKEFQDSLFLTDDPTTAGKILEMAGFVYDPEQVIYYSSLNPLQRKFGFNPLYDAAAPYTGMVYDTERFFFTSGKRDWMIQVWKGQYGITVGAEIGVYNKPIDRNSSHYDCVGDEDMIEMTMIVYKNGSEYFTRGPEKHWWLTGFKLLDVTNIVDLKVFFIIKLEDADMVNAFEGSMREFVKNNEKNNVKYERVLNDFYIEWE